MPTTCTINFENPHAVYFANELLSGTASLTLTKTKKVRGVYVRIFGRAYAHWTELCNKNHTNSSSRESSTHRVSYTGSEVCLNKEFEEKTPENAKNGKKYRTISSKTAHSVDYATL